MNETVNDLQSVYRTQWKLNVKVDKKNSQYFQKVRNDVLLQRGYDRKHQKI